MSRPAALALEAKPRLGFLGVGWIGRQRMEAVLAEDLAEAAAVCDPSAEMAGEAAKLAPDAAIVGSLDELLALQPDGVVIATPSALHAEQSIRALEAGIAVFCQKPLGRSAAEVSEVLAAAERADLLFGVDLSYRFTEAAQAIRTLVRDGALGRVFAANLVFHNAYGPDKAWFYDRKLSGGGCIMDLGVHLVDLALWTLDFPVVTAVRSRLFAQGRPARPDEVEDFASVQLDLETGATVQIACSWRLQAGQEAVIQAEFFGSQGGAALHNENGSFYDFTGKSYSGTRTRILTSPPDPWGGRAAAEWARRLAHGQGFDSSTEGLLQVASVLDRIYRAAA